MKNNKKLHQLTLSLLTLVLIIIVVSSAASAATLKVGPKEKYKTIQKAVDAAKNGDTIYVHAGTYKEIVSINGKDLIFQGAKVKGKYQYPTVYGFEFTFDDKVYNPGSGDINGFKIIKSGIMYDLAGNNIVRNNYFYNCGVGAGGQSCSANTIMNNKFTGNYNYDGIYLMENYDNVVKGNTFTKARNGLVLRWGATCTTITDNTFNQCKVGVLSGYLPKILLGNAYKGNKINVKIVDDF
jgi:parallel beta-helix repeat protein